MSSRRTAPAKATSEDTGLRTKRTPSMLTDDDVYLFNEGTHHALGEKLGAHIVDGGVAFAVWAPNADHVAVIGDFNGWNAAETPMRPRERSGIWEAFVPGLGKGECYKYRVHAPGFEADKADPFAQFAEEPPRTGSRVWDLSYDWSDGEWTATRAQRNALDAPTSIYELHLGSWRRGEDNRVMGYREIAPLLAEHCESMGFTHVELLPVMEHPFYGSWGYQCTGFFAPTSRYGTPQDLMFMIDVLHQRGIGVLLDWVPSHFPTDDFALGRFDGTHLYEHADPRQGIHPDWNSYVFNYGRNEVRAFLVSSAMHWLRNYHADGLRVDAVASMLYLDYSRKQGEWVPNVYGGRENLDAMAFLRRFNTDVYERLPDVQTIAEESTAWPAVSRPTYVGGLGFGMKWDMGWMHDALSYASLDPIYRRYHHNELTFRSLYQFSENFVLPLSHDEVVHGKGSLIGKMPGDEWQRFANLRALYGLMYSQPGKKLLFMGGELAQWREWDHESSLDWHLLQFPLHDGIRRWVADLNATMRAEPALHQLDVDPLGFEWIDANDAEQSVLCFLRRGRDAREMVLCVFNFTPIPRLAYRVGVPAGGRWRELLNGDATIYGGAGMGNFGGVEADDITWHGRGYSVELTLPPLACVLLKPDATPPVTGRA